MTAPLTVRPLPESAEPDLNTTEPRPAHTPAPATSRRTPRTRRDHGFSMLELLVGMVILGVLGAIGYGVYTAFISDARDTTLDQNIQTAAAEIQSVLALDPNLAGAALVDAMTSRTSFDWIDGDWDFPAAGNDATTVRLQFIDAGAAAVVAVGGTSPSPPDVTWGLTANSAIRIHLANNEQEWRCALVVLKPSAANITAIDTTNFDDAFGVSKAAQIRGIWYDGGSVVTDAGLHDCSPVSGPAASWTGTTSGATTCTPTTPGTAAAVTDGCLPSDARTWQIRADGQHDETSTAEPDHRTLHRTTSGLDDNG